MTVIGNPRSFHKRYKFLVEIDGVATGVSLDAYAPQVLPSGPIELATGVELKKGQHRIRFTVIATNPASLGHGFGIDCIELRP